MFGLFFDFLLDKMLDDLKIYDLLRHFQTTWIEGLSTGRKAPGTPSFLLPGTASTFDRSIAQLNRTNKFVEEWNKKFAGNVGHGKISSYLIGQQPTKRKKAYLDKDNATSCQPAGSLRWSSH